MMSGNFSLRLPPHVEQSAFDDGPSMASTLADCVAAMLRLGLWQRGDASLLVSGGRSPLPFLRALSQRKLDWSRVSVSLVDERWVPPDHPDSNAGLVAANLLQGPASAARFVPLYGGEASPAAGLAACEERLRSLPRPFDAVVLGMGEDGHFASLFPGVAGLAELLASGAPTVAATHPPAAPHARITLSLAALLDARNLVLQITGERKRAVLEEAAERGADERARPVAALLRQTTGPLRVFFSPSE
jgi:6-phosphogluconolactonase